MKPGYSKSKEHQIECSRSSNQSSASGMIYKPEEDFDTFVPVVKFSSMIPFLVWSLMFG